MLLSAVFFVLACFYIVRPLMWWIARRVPEGEAISDVHVTLVLTGVMIAGVCTDAIGIHSVFGAFVYGLVIPSGQLGVVLIEKLEDFVTGLLLPLFFAISASVASAPTSPGCTIPLPWGSSCSCSPWPALPRSWAPSLSLSLTP